MTAREQTMDAAIDEGKATALLDSWIEATQRAVAAGR